MEHRRKIVLILVIFATLLSYGLLFMYGTFWVGHGISPATNILNDVAVRRSRIHATQGYANSKTAVSRKLNVVNPNSKELLMKRARKWRNGANVPRDYETWPMATVTNNGTGYFDCPNMAPIRFLPNFKSPCWNGTSDNGPVHDNNIHCLPYFYIIGVMKCGTSDLFKRLLQHPDIVDPGFKEAGWFGSRQQPPRLAQGMPDRRPLSYYVWQYRNAAQQVLQHPTRTVDGRTYFGQVFGDGSPSTIYQNDGWRLLPGNENATEPRFTNVHCIQRLVPGAKIIVIFRDPVTRLYSNYLHLLRNLVHHRPTRNEFHANVVKATDEFNTCLRRRSLRACAYDGNSKRDAARFMFRLGVGLYSVYMREVYTVFRRENVHTVLLPDYHENMGESLQHVFAFLGLRSLDQSEMRSILRMDVKGNNSYTREQAGPMLNKTEQILRQFYAPYNKEMAKLMDDSRYLFSNR